MMIRPAEMADLQAVAEIHVRSWQTAYRGIMPDTMLEAQDIAECAERWGRTLDRFPGNLLVAVGGQTPVLGFCYVAQVTDQPDDKPYDGRVYAIHIRPDLRRQAIGSQLMQAAFARLSALGCCSSIVWTLEGLTPSRRFYEALGGTFVKSKIGDFGGTMLTEVAYAWGDLPGM